MFNRKYIFNPGSFFKCYYVSLPECIKTYPQKKLRNDFFSCQRHLWTTLHRYKEGIALGGGFSHGNDSRFEWEINGGIFGGAGGHYVTDPNNALL